MNVSLVSTTQPFSNLDSAASLLAATCEGAEDIIAYCARVSNPENQNNTETAPKLLKFLIKHGHWSPFEMVDMTVEIKTSRAIAAQILRHRSFSFQEFSQISKLSQIEATRFLHNAKIPESNLAVRNNQFFKQQQQPDH